MRFEKMLRQMLSRKEETLLPKLGAGFNSASKAIITRGLFWK